MPNISETKHQTIDSEQGEFVLHGISNDHSTTLSFDNSTHVFTVTGAFHYYYKGERVAVSSPLTLDLDDETSWTFPTVAGYFIYFEDTSGVLVASTTAWNLEEHVPIAYIYWNSSSATGIGALFDERHSAERNLKWHGWAHSTVNTRYLNGFVKTLPTTGTPNDISITGGEIADEDIITTVVSAQTDVRVWYEVQAAVWSFEGVSGTPWQLPYYDSTHPAGGSPQWPLTTSNALAVTTGTITGATGTTGTMTLTSTTGLSAGNLITATNGTGSVGVNAVVTGITDGATFTFSADSGITDGTVTALAATYLKVPLAAAKYMPAWVYATPDQEYPIYVVISSMATTGDYNSATEARQAPLPSTPFIQEGKLLYRLIYSTTGALTYDATQDDFRTSGTVASAGVSTSIGASQVSFAPYSTIAATTVQGAIEELLDESDSGASITISDDTTTNANTYYLSMTDNQTTGTATGLTVSSTKLYFNPSTGTLNATVFNTLSDATYKEDIFTINNATDTIKQLNGVGFTWKDNGNKSFGVIAQDLELVIPELVSGDLIKSVNYDGLVAFLINTIKEMDARITELENK